MSRSRSVFRQPGSQHFQVLHRSLRDPLANDENASQHVLSEVSRRGEPSSSSSTWRKTNTAAEEEAEHGILYGDDYDYLQHLRTIGTEREAVFVTAETQQNKKSSQLEHRTVDGIALPPEALPAEGQERDYAEMMGIPDRPFGLQPEMDPKVREVLEALEDDAYVGQEDDRREEDFFETLMGEDEAGNDDPLEHGASGLVEEEETDERTDWERHMDQFKVAKPAATASDSEDELEEDFGSEAGDTIAELRQSSARRKPRPAAGGTAQDSAFSMSSSAMFRNEGLRTLDDRFDHLEQEYEEDSLSEEDSEDDDQPVDLSEKRPDLSNILDDFLSRHQYVGGAHTASLPNDATRYRELDDLRAQLRDVDLDKHTDNNKAYILQRAAQLDQLDQRGKHEKSTQVAVDDGAAGPADRWDCQTILSTRTNLENHPKMIRLREVSNKKRSSGKEQPRQTPPQEEDEPRRIILDPKTGFPSLAESLPPQPEAPTTSASDQASSSAHDSEEEDDDEEIEQGPAPGVLARSRQETKEEKKARKQAVKGDRANRRAEKKGHKDLFNAEVARQKGLQARGNKADRQIGQRGVVALS